MYYVESAFNINTAYTRNSLPYVLLRRILILYEIWIYTKFQSYTKSALY